MNNNHCIYLVSDRRSSDIADMLKGVWPNLGWGEGGC